MLTGGRLTVEDAYAYAKFARVALRHQRHRLPGPAALRARRPSSWPHRSPGVTDVTYADVENAPAVVLVGLEPEEECPILFLRLRKAYRKKKLHGLRAWRRSPAAGWRSSAPSWSRTVPGDEASVLAEHADGRRGAEPAGRDPDRRRAAGDRARAGSPPRRRWPRRTGAKLAWVPRRAGDRGAVDAGCLPNLLPGGRPVTDAGRPGRAGRGVGPRGRGASRARPGRDTDGILAAAAAGQLGALVVAGVDPADLADPRLAEAGAGHGAVPGQPGAAR